MSNIDYSNAVAIIGMSGFFPKANNVEEFWENIKGGKNCISFYANEDVVDGSHTDNNFYVQASGYADGIEKFDPSFFGYSAKEIELMDPQQRIFLRLAWEAIENAGYNVDRLKFPVGVFAGAGMNWYLLNNLMTNIDLLKKVGVLQASINNRSDFLTTRISYNLGLRGPSVNVNTACSTSLVAVHMACQSLLNFECDMALAGGVSLLINKDGYHYQADGVLSKDGFCRAFDSNADGTVPGSGAGIVVIKRLQDAIDDKDDIDAIILGSAINNDGNQKVGFHAPSVEGQRQVIAEALEVSGVSAESISYIEAHGTATSLGDAVEVSALKQIFGNDKKDKYCALGSVKTNVGHLDAAAGIAGLIKTVQCLKNKVLVPSLHFKKSNPHLKLDDSPFYVNTELTCWPKSDSARRAGVSSFGIGGTNAHIILQEAPEREKTPSDNRGDVILLSAKNLTSLSLMKQKLASFLKNNNEVKIRDVAFTLATARKTFNYRSAFSCSDISMSIAQLTDENVVDDLPIPENVGDIVFMFSGVGEHYVGMASDLYLSEPSFKEAMDECCRKVKEHSDLDIISLLFDNNSSSIVKQKDTIDFRAMVNRNKIESHSIDPIDSTRLLHPIVFSVEYSLAVLLRSWGIEPNKMIGYSLGEYAAACIAGVFSLGDAIKAVVKRAEIIQDLNPGAMLAVSLPVEKIEMYLSDSISIAAINGPSYTVLSGDINSILMLEKKFETLNVIAVRIKSEHAFHSHMMLDAKQKLYDLFVSLKLTAPTIKYVSNVSGEWITDKQATDPNYWVQHTCSTVQFDHGIKTLTKSGKNCYIEVGPGAALSSLIMLNDKSVDLVVRTLKTKYENISDTLFFKNSLSYLWKKGLSIDWALHYKKIGGNKIKLPTYQFYEQEYWVEPKHKIYSEIEVANKSVVNAFPERVVAEEKLSKNNEFNEIQQILAEIWMQLLGCHQIKPGDNFFQLGGSSLLAIQLMSNIYEVFEIKFNLVTIFNAPSFAAFSSIVEFAITENSSSVEKLQIENDLMSLDKKINNAYIYTLPNNLNILQYNRVETEHFYKDIFESKVYLKNGLKISDGDIIFDVGSNVGLFSIFSSMQAQQLKIFSFEPATPLFECLKINVEKLSNTHKLFNFGLSNKNSTEEFTFYPNSTGMSSFYPDFEEEKDVLLAVMSNERDQGNADVQEIQINTDDFVAARLHREVAVCELRRMSDVISEQNISRIDLLKIDVQKSELDVLEGISPDDWGKVKQIVIEVHDVEGRVEYIKSLLMDKGFNVIVEQDSLYDNSCIYNLYALRSCEV